MRFGVKNVSYITIVFLRWCVNECAWSSNEKGGGVYNPRVALVHFAGEIESGFMLLLCHVFQLFQEKIRETRCLYWHLRLMLWLVHIYSNCMLRRFIKLSLLME